MHYILGASVLTLHLLSHLSPVPDDLTPEEQQELENIRRRKQELLEDIQVIQEKDMGTVVMFVCTNLKTLSFSVLLVSCRKGFNYTFFLHITCFRS